MFIQYIYSLGINFKEILEKMTDLRVINREMVNDDQAIKNYTVVSVIPYKDLENKFSGQFNLGFTDNKMALYLASEMCQKMGLPEVSVMNETAEDVLNEFVNILVGRTISDWDAKGLSVRFEPPLIERNKVIHYDVSKNSNAYQIILNFKKGTESLTRSLSLNVNFSNQIEKSVNRQRKILLVDDSKTMRMVFVEALQKAGYLVEEAVDGMDALEKHQIFKPDLTIMDIDMPKLNGLDAILQIYQQDPKAKFIVMTSNSRRDHVLTAKQLKVLDYMIKPVQTKQLLSKFIDIFG